MTLHWLSFLLSKKITCRARQFNVEFDDEDTTKMLVNLSGPEDCESFIYLVFVFFFMKLNLEKIIIGFI